MTPDLGIYEWETEQLLDCLHRCDKEVANGIRTVVTELTPSHTLNSKKFSASTLIKKHLDPAISSWLKRNGHESDWNFSDLIRDPSKFDVDNPMSFLKGLARLGLSKDRWDNSFFSATCERLIDCAYIFSNHKSDHGKVVQIEPEDGRTFDAVNERIGRGTNLGARAKKQSAKNLPWFLTRKRFRLQDNNMCLACGQKILAQEEREKCIEASKVANVKRALEEGAHYTSFERGSLIYCAEHTESVNESRGGKQAREWRGRYLSLLQAFERKEVSQRILPFLAPSYMLEFSRLAIRNKPSRRLMGKIETLLPKLFSADTSSADAEIVGAQIAEYIRTIFIENLRLEPRPLLPPRLTIGVVSGKLLVCSGALGLIEW